MQSSFGSLAAPLQKIATFLQRYSVVIGIALFCGLAASLILQTADITGATPDSEAVAEKLQSTAVPRIDSDTAAAIKNLREQNILIESGIDDGRDNPFAE